MSDLISRQAAIDAVAELASSMSVCISVDECHGMKRMQGMAVRALDDLPSVQPQSTMGQVTEDVQLTKDCISRQAAIDLLKQMRKDGDMIPWEGKDVFARIRKLPSAQPDIIRCKDCKYYKAYEYTGELACHYVIGGTVIRNLNDYCSRAERIEHEQFD